MPVQPLPHLARLPGEAQCVSRAKLPPADAIADFPDYAEHGLQREAFSGRGGHRRHGRCKGEPLLRGMLAQAPEQRAPDAARREGTGAAEGIIRRRVPRLDPRLADAPAHRQPQPGDGGQHLLCRIGLPLGHQLDGDAGLAQGGDDGFGHEGGAHQHRAFPPGQRRLVMSQPLQPSDGAASLRSGVVASRMAIGGPGGAFGSAGRMVFCSASGSRAATALAARRMVGVER